MSIRLVIDDERVFPALPNLEDIYCRTVPEAIVTITDYVTRYQRHQGYGVDIMEQMWFDHDLGPTGGDIMDIVALMEVLAPWAEEMVVSPFDMMVIHSRNPIGARAIERKLSDAGYHTYIIENLPPKTTVVERRDG